ncbi:hypothetical protein AK812_SmicGene41362 [Symbiodinium microadriaticum]|uniref:CCHC-type domain-containing protein n=2 Tax=Symbiodinium microadriaticum TaxID=2951 RepID=A0A1Q9C6B5_SYMMI|nr:hypothetical protein AK812_SmicGene41362 [Symbiodinium microadriaticum]
MQKQLRSALDTLREPNLEANLLKAEEPDQEDPLHAGSIRPNTSARDLICNMPQTNKRQKHVTDEEKHHRRQFHWRRMVLRLHHHGQQSFFARWDNAVRRLSEHKVELPQEYLGFLPVMALQVAPDEVKLMMNYTQGKLTQKAVKEWIRVQEADLAWSASQQKPRKAESIMMMDETSEFPEEIPEPEAVDEENVEDEAKEILATMVREHSKGGFRRSFKSVNDAKRAKGSARGYGAHRDPSGRFGASKGVGSGKGSENVRTGQSYKISIEALKKKTRCARCHQVGHWHKECPNPAKPKESYYLENESEEALFLHYLDFVDY